ncbi:hypothetical protein [Granulicella mallensis]|uniref:Uncharacterized protein n=1 Tax=Granulicella mallensis TaxID=940614 RepID=A0A7W8EAE0_9BACT|nr:hypothetical protein [Granulicella mallensis]MBB5064712.1 hypothetical protein [Granulicella mallensis]
MATATIYPVSKAENHRVPVEVYLTSMYDPDCDYVDGELLERNVGETPHASAQKFFITFFAVREKA